MKNAEYQSVACKNNNLHVCKKVIIIKSLSLNGKVFNFTVIFLL